MMRNFGRLRISLFSPLISVLTVPFGFVALVLWFQFSAVYRLHFFENGWFVLGYNCARILFVLYLAWLLYFTGILVLRAIPGAAQYSKVSYLEQGVIAFSIGIGVWQLLMLILGLSGLLYTSLVAVLAFLLLCLSVPHFQALCIETRDFLLRRHCVRPAYVSARMLSSGLLIGTALILLVTRGLYPGGGHDYYTHYFYYYHDVILNHGLKPNDVWYHFYYSKGAGLFFFSILLTDPQAPELVSFCFVIFASAGLASVIVRVLPSSNWPAVVAALYLMFYIAPLAAAPYATGGPGGDFQKLHEMNSACVVLVVCLACLRHGSRAEFKWVYLAASVAVITAADILTPVTGALIGAICLVAAAVAFFLSSSDNARYYGILFVCAYGGGGAILGLNYLVTGLASDQALDVMWSLANIERLNSLGVLPMIFMTAWIRDNYSENAAPFGWPTIALLSDYLRWPAVWPLLVSGAAVTLPAYWRNRSDLGKVKPSLASFSLALFFACGVVFLSVLAGRSQTFSFFRLTTFFFPVLLLIGALGWSAYANSFKERAASRFLTLYLPLLFLVGLPLCWQNSYGWLDQVRVTAKQAILFFKGNYSLADAYSHQERSDALGYGGIYPGALQAMRQVGPGVRIWSMHIHSYCMVPECRIESVVSFNMSRHYNDILNGKAETAAELLKQEGLNYFLISKDLVLFDVLQYSKLFSPDHIADNLAIKWTDGTTYLLTWRGEGTAPITKEFLDFYRQQFETSKHPSFNFERFPPLLDQAMKKIEESSHPWKPIKFPWRHN